MVFAYSLERAGLDVVTSFSRNRSWASMKVIFLSDSKKQCLWFPLQYCFFAVFSIRELCGTRHLITGLMVALGLVIQPSAFSCPTSGHCAWSWRYEIVSEKSVAIILPVPSWIECDFGVSLKELWRQIQFLKGERGFSKDQCKWFTLKINILNHFDLRCPKDAN